MDKAIEQSPRRGRCHWVVAASDPSSCLRTREMGGRHPYGQVRVLGATGRQRLRRDPGRAGKAGRLRDLPGRCDGKWVSGLSRQMAPSEQEWRQETWEG